MLKLLCLGYFGCIILTMPPTNTGKGAPQKPGLLFPCFSFLTSPRLHRSLAHTIVFKMSSVMIHLRPKVQFFVCDAKRYVFLTFYWWSSKLMMPSFHFENKDSHIIFSPPIFNPYQKEMKTFGYLWLYLCKYKYRMMDGAWHSSINNFYIFPLCNACLHQPLHSECICSPGTFFTKKHSKHHKEHLKGKKPTK